MNGRGISKRRNSWGAVGMFPWEMFNFDGLSLDSSCNLSTVLTISQSQKNVIDKKKNIGSNSKEEGGVITGPPRGDTPIY